MPQKKTVKKTASKTTRKTTSKRPARRTTKKPKVYIPAYKAIIFCCVIITLCMGLLLFTTLKSPDAKIAQSVTERFQEEKTENKAEQIKKEDSKKSEKKKEEASRSN